MKKYTKEEKIKINQKLIEEELEPLEKRKRRKALILTIITFPFIIFNEIKESLKKK